jgi:hypothetical protein
MHEQRRSSLWQRSALRLQRKPGGAAGDEDQTAIIHQWTNASAAIKMPTRQWGCDISART